MTRFLSEALQATEPFFRQEVQRLEVASGHPNADIRFSSEVRRETQAKLRELGLDPRDTTAEELYHALQERLKADDTQLTKRLRTEAATHISAEGNVVAGMIHVLQQLPGNQRCFALKSSKLRAIIKKVPPKKAMKRLGYRSLESFLKHETPVSALVAAWLTEGEVWQHRLLDQYKQLKPGDFENRTISITQTPDSKRWHELTNSVVSQNRHNLICFKELGTLVFLPFSNDMPSGVVTVSLSLALYELNQIQAAGTYLKLCQVRSDFGSLIREVAADEPQLRVPALGQAVSWHLIQQYYARLSGHFREDILGPHIRLEDMAWQSIEETLSIIEPRLGFWKDSAHLGLLHQRQPVSLNIVDAALNYCNHLPFEQRIVQYFQQSLWHELLLRYLRHDTVEQAVLVALQPKLVAETVPA